jgi:hypothetical protein
MRKYSKAEREIIAWLEWDRGRKLTAEEIYLSLEQARAIGDLEGEPENNVILCGVVAGWRRECEKQGGGRK